MADKNTIKSWFETDDIPSQAQFSATWDSFWHKDEKIPITAIDDIENILAEKADAEALINHRNDSVAHAELFLGKEDVIKKGVASGYAPLNEFTKIASEYLTIVNDFITGGATSLASAETVKTLKTQINGIQLLLEADDVNLDTVQERIDMLKEIQLTLDSILVNDLTTGGTTKALTSEMGKTLKGLIDALTNIVQGKQDTLISGETIKTINGNSILGSGDIAFTGGGASGVKFWNVKDYGAIADGITDDTIKIQDTINACFLAGGGTVYFPNGVYAINGALDTNSNSQIYFPLNSYKNSVSLTTIKLLGETAPNQFSNPFTVLGSNTPSDKSVILKSNLLNSGNIIGTRYETVDWGQFNFLHAQIENICVRVRSKTSNIDVSAQATGIDLRKVAYFNASNLEVSPTSNHNLIIEPSTSAYGIRFPQTNNFCFSNAVNVLVLGMYVGFDTYEHCSLDKCFADVCVNGLVFNPTNHSIHVGKIIIARCRYNIKALPNSFFYINHVSFEDDYLKYVSTPTWNATLFDLYDISGDTSNGLIRFHNVRAGFGVDYSSTKRNIINPNIKFIKINELNEFTFLTDPYSPPVTNLKAYWKFDETTGNYADSSINGRNAIRVNGATSGVGKIGNAMLTSNAGNQYANAGSVGLSYDNSALTICGWFKINTTSQPYQILFNKGDETGREYNLYYSKSNGAIILQFFNGTVFKGDVRLSAVMDTWFFLCVELIGSTLKITINNTISATATVTDVSGQINKDLTIGASSTAGESLDGGVDELSIWNRELNIYEKNYLYNEGAGNSITI